MSIRNLDALFKPSSIALIGAGKTPHSVGAVLARNLLAGGFSGKIFPVNPKYEEIEGYRCYPEIDSLPAAPDLAVLATPPHLLPKMIENLGKAGTRAAVIITAGYGRSADNRDRLWKESLQQSARPSLLRMVGPNCLGIMVPGSRLNASFGQITPRSGNLAFVAQSGAVLTSVLDWATAREIGFSHFVSLGDMVDVDFGDMLDYLSMDYTTKAILLYIEAITHSRKFMSAARAAARIKPVIVVKSGRYAKSAQAATTHSGAMAGVDAVYDAAFRRTGVLRVMDLEALFNSVETLALGQPPKGERLAILSNGGGIGVLATDKLIEKEGRLAELSPATIQQLDQVLPSTWSRTNPIDIIGDADGTRYGKALAVLLADRGVDGILVMNCPTAITSSEEAAQTVIKEVEQRAGGASRPVVLASWLGNGSAEKARQLFRRSRIPCYSTPEDGVRGFMQMVRHRHSQEMLMETVPDISSRFTPDRTAARTIISQALASGEEWLSATDAKKMLTAYGIPVVESHTAATAEGAGELTAILGCPVALKILSPDIQHKSDVAGVRLNLESRETVTAAATTMLNHISSQFPQADIHGVTVEPMVNRPHARELLIGAFEDEQFGPVIVFGHGGTAVEVINDTAICFPPLNMRLAREVMSCTRVYRLLQGYRNTAAADLDELALTLIKVSHLISDVAEIKELDLNPLLADENGVIALDARLRISGVPAGSSARLAIQPYPHELEENICLPDGKKLLLRPVRPEDENGFHRIFAALSPEEIRMRFLHPMRSLSHQLAARLTQIDYDREMALVLEGQNTYNMGELYGGVRIAADPDNEAAEISILLRQDMTGSGLGPMLMRKIIEHARKKKIGCLFGEVLTDNTPMLRLASAFGFQVKPDPEDGGIRRIELVL